ncbi:MAG: hypothetical protein Q9M16_10495 [Mariprofundus sp.]|nr:hypothetical protein [Mariprofundus sp.]
MDLQKALNIERLTHWTNEAGESLCFSVGDDEAEIKRQVNAGISRLYRLDDGDAWLVTRLERFGKRVELACLCFEGRNMAKWAKIIKIEAKKAGVDVIRFHVKNDAVARLVRFTGAKKRETVYEVVI